MATISLLLCLGLLYRIGRNTGWSQCDSMMASAVVFGSYLAFVTEVLSLSHSLARGPLLVAWLLGAALTAIFWWTRRRLQPQLLGRGRSGPTISRGSIIVGSLIFCTLGITGLFSAPSNWDSMTYHLPRVMHWAQNRSVADYPTNCLPQLFQPPWAEYAILHLQLLCGSDRFAFFPQWVAFGGSAVAAVALAARLGAGAAGQTLAFVFAITLPTAILQAVSTQNNLVLGFWLLCGANGIVLLARQKSLPFRNRLLVSIFIGAAVGLAVLTKGTAYVIAAPMMFWFVMSQMSRPRQGVWSVTIVAMIIAGLNAGHWIRNSDRFGSPLTPPGESEYRVRAMSPALWTANFIRNAALHAATPSRDLNHRLVQMLNGVQRLIGADPDDPRTTLPGSHFALRPPHNDEDLTGNPVHLIALLIICGLIAYACVAMNWRMRLCAASTAIKMLAVALGTWGLFCGLLKWRPFHARLHLPIFLLAAAPFGYFFERFLIQRVMLFTAVGFILIAISPILFNPSHPLLGKNNIFVKDRDSQYFYNRPELFQAYRRASDLAAGIAGPTGLIAGADAWEYPLWVLIGERRGRPPEIVDLAGEHPFESVPVNIGSIIETGVPPTAEIHEGWTLVKCGTGANVYVRNPVTR